MKPKFLIVSGLAGIFVSGLVDLVLVYFLKSLTTFTSIVLAIFSQIFFLGGLVAVIFAFLKLYRPKNR